MKRHLLFIQFFSTKKGWESINIGIDVIFIDTDCSYTRILLSPLSGTVGSDLHTEDTSA